MPSVLIVDDLVSIHEMLDAVIQPNGFATDFATDGSMALTKYKGARFDVVLSDIDMKPMDGLTLLKNLRLYDPAAVVILITAYASTDSAIQALQSGAFDYIAKPFKVDELIKSLRRGVEFRQDTLRRLKEEKEAREAAASAPAPAAGAGSMASPAGKPPELGSGPKMQRVIQQVAKLASGRSPILIQGEFGTGKRSLAEYVHHLSGRKGPFTFFDGASTPAPRLAEGLRPTGPESFLAGAREGTLVLQNIQALPTDAQGALAALLQAGTGDTRLICTASADLEQLLNEGRFLEDLFYRLAALPIVVPPLREHAEDIPGLVRAFSLATTNPAYDSHQIEFTEDALKVLGTYFWPGNVQELQQIITRVVATTEQRVITAAQLPLRLNQLDGWPSLEEYLAGQRRQYVSNVLNACRGDRRRAAEILRCDPSEFGP